MPTLDWIGKKAVLNHHRQVPYRLLRCDPTLSAGDPESGNLLVQGDNLLALKALLPYYAGKVKCIYIDPPYNTGNEKWVYNDAVNSPEMQRWLGKVVGAEAEDLSRHDKWLCMMYPRVSLLKDFLTEDGAIFISIDDVELHNLRLLMDEVFGPRNFVAILAWQKRVSPANDAQYFSSDHEYVVVYALSKTEWHPHRLKRSVGQLRNYKNPDNDPRGPWNSVTYTCNKSIEERPNLYHGVTNPNTGETIFPRKTAVWKYDAETHQEHVRKNLLYWGSNGRARMPRLKAFLSEMRDVVPRSVLLYSDYGHTQEARTELLEIIAEVPFTTPKPVRLLRRILEIGSDSGSLILDSFTGSGTTGHAVLAMNKQDGGNRRFILVEMDESICRTITAQRLTRAVNGYASRAVASISDRREEDRRSETAATEVASISDGRNEDKRVEGLGGGFRYCGLGEPLFDESGKICGTVRFSDLAAHVFFTETGTPIPKRATGKSPFLGEHDGKAIYLLFNGIMGDKTAKGGNVLTHEILKALPEPARRSETAATTKVIYGEGCRLGDMRLKREGIVFKQVPYAIKVS